MNKHRVSVYNTTHTFLSWDYDSPVYYVELKEFHVAGKPLSLDPSVFDGKDGTMLDSGTTFAYLPKAAFIEFKQAVRIYIQFMGSPLCISYNFKYNCLNFNGRGLFLCR